MSEFTLILEQVAHGDPNAAAELFPVVYEELRRLAAQKMAREAASHTLQPTALGIAVPTAKQWWAYARAWLTVELRTVAR